jgi:TonB family protein
MDVTDVLRDRMQEPAGFQRMVTASIAIHLAALALVMFAPQGLFHRGSEAPAQVMTISLGGGGEGPRTGGMTQMGGRPVQVQTPPEETPKREAVRPPAAKTPEMVMPTKAEAKPSKSAATVVKQAPDEARGRTPTKGAQVAAGTAIAETSVRGQGFGLSSGGGPGSGSTLDVADFCCPDYIVTMLERVRASWQQQQSSSGIAVVHFLIQRDGRLTNYEVVQSSGSSILDLAALRAVAQTRQIPPLPGQYPNPTLGLRLAFEYK